MLALHGTRRPLLLGGASGARALLHTAARAHRTSRGVRKLDRDASDRAMAEAARGVSAEAEVELILRGALTELELVVVRGTLEALRARVCTGCELGFPVRRVHGRPVHVVSVGEDRGDRLCLADELYVDPAELLGDIRRRHAAELARGHARVGLGEPSEDAEASEPDPGR